MSSQDRIRLRDSYIEGWYRMDAEMLLAATAENFVFDDPAEAEPVARADLAAYMQRWERRTRSLGANNEWVLTHHTRVDKDGLLTDWLWWELVNTALQGSAIVLTVDDGVLLERITYFDRNRRSS